MREEKLAMDAVRAGPAREARPSRLLGTVLVILAGLLCGCGQPGGTGTTSVPAPYETQLAGQCASDTHWSDAGRQYDSLPNYIAMTTGLSGSVLTPFTCDCAPSSSVSVTADNIFRQVRTAGGTERSYGEGMSGNCSDSGTTYAPKHNPALYMWGGADRTACQHDDVPMGSGTAGTFVDALSSGTLPTFSLVAPNLCDDTHDCGTPAGDQFLQTLLPRIVSSQAYRSGKTAVFVVWDEDSFIPNIVIAPSVISGTTSPMAVNHYALLRATEEMLGLRLLGDAAGATSLRTVFHI